MKRRFEMTEGGSTKFWEVELAGKSVTVRYGRLGANGQEKTKDFDSAAAAQKEHDKLVREKTGKGYVEQSRTAAAKKAVATKAPQGDERAALRAADREVLDAFGELTLVEPEDVPELVSSFTTAEDADVWEQVFADIELLAEEADGGVVGYWKRTSPPVVVYVDNEGSFHLTGRSIVEHFAWVDYRGEHTALLARFCEKHGITAPRAKKVREAAMAKLESPERRFDALLALAKR